jgi:uncharacterized protein DUF4911
LPCRKVDTLEPFVRFFKVDRRDLVYLKFVLEAYEGMSTLSTVEPVGGIVRLSIPYGFEEDMQSLVDALSGEISLTEVEFAQESD